MSYTNSFGAHPRFVLDTTTWQQKKKPNPSASEANISTEALPSNNIIVPINNNNNHGEDLEVEDLADGGLEVNLHDLSISMEDIQAMKRIDACLAERQYQAQQAQAGTSNAPAAAGAKGKGLQLTPEEMEDQLNKFKE
jgi:hypothetical protein